MNRRVLVIGNPAAGRGRARARWRGVAASVAARLGAFDLIWTRGPGHAREIARREGGGRRLLVAFGGDGTASEVARGLAAASGADGRSAELGLLPSGTGNDFAGAAGVPGRLAEAVAFLARTPARRTDLGRVEANDGRIRTFLNSGSVGLAAAVNRRAARSAARLGRAAYAGAAARELLTARAGRYRVGLDDAPVRPRLLLNVTLLNSRRFGGGIPLAPPADPGDGRLDAVLIGPLGALGIADAVSRLARGAHLDHPAIEHRPVRQVWIEALDGDRMLLELDGEEARLPGAIRFSVVPGAVRIRRT